MIDLAWLLVCWLVQFPVWFTRPSRFARGRILTMPIRRRVRPLRGGNACRCAQWAVLFAINLTLSTTYGRLEFWLPWIALFLDDWLTGNDDEWRRYRDTVRNKVRWLMQLPAPPVTNGGTA